MANFAESTVCIDGLVKYAVEEMDLEKVVIWRGQKRALSPLVGFSVCAGHTPASP